MSGYLSDELKDFVKKKVESGQYPSEEAVIEAALRRLRDQEDDSRSKVQTIEDLIDREFVEYCAPRGR